MTPAAGWAGRFPILTDDAHGRARIEDVPGDVLGAAIDAGQIAIVPGFQGVSRARAHHHPGPRWFGHLGGGGGRGPGGCACDIYTDVNGVYTTDPRIKSRARRLEKGLL